MDRDAEFGNDDSRCSKTCAKAQVIWDVSTAQVRMDTFIMYDTYHRNIRSTRRAVRCNPKHPIELSERDPLESIQYITVHRQWERSDLVRQFLSSVNPLRPATSSLNRSSSNRTSSRLASEVRRHISNTTAYIRAHSRQRRSPLVRQPKRNSRTMPIVITTVMTTSPTEMTTVSVTVRLGERPR